MDTERIEIIGIYESQEIFVVAFGNTVFDIIDHINHSVYSVSEHMNGVTDAPNKDAVIFLGGTLELITADSSNLFRDFVGWDWREFGNAVKYTAVISLICGNTRRDYNLGNGGFNIGKIVRDGTNARNCVEVI